VEKRKRTSREAFQKKGNKKKGRNASIDISQAEKKKKRRGNDRSILRKEGGKPIPLLLALIPRGEKEYAGASLAGNVQEGGKGRRNAIP